MDDDPKFEKNSATEMTDFITNGEEASESKERTRVGKLWQKVRPSVVCPGPAPSTLHCWATTATAALVLFGAVISLFSVEALPPKGPIFQLLVLFVAAAVFGQLLGLLRLPPLLAMLITGIVLRNVGFFQLGGLYTKVVSSLRLLAMVVILIKAGLGLDAKALRQLSCLVLRLAFCPCITEAVTAMFAARLFLGMPWIWGILLGFVLAAVSPAVVVPSMLDLKSRGYGEDKGISTLIIAASSVDDIAAISAFGIFLGTIFSSGSLTQQILQGPLELVIGLAFGFFYGFLLMFFPHFKQDNVEIWRGFLIGLGGIIAIFGSQMLGFDGAGPLGCITSAFIASCGWKSEDGKATAAVENIFSVLWKIFQPVLFGLIGTEIAISALDSNTVLLGLAVLVCGLVLRITTVGIITHGGVLTLKERLFVAIAWLPKATVQAALAPVALDIARRHESDSSQDLIILAQQVLTVAVLAILVTAPIGAIGISFAGPRLLAKKPPEG